MLTQYWDMVNRIKFVHTVTDIDHGIPKDLIEKKPHCHDLYEIFYFVSGDSDYFVENTIYTLKQGDFFVIRNDEFHCCLVQSEKIFEKISIRFDPCLAEFFSPPGFDLLQCFNHRPKGDKNKISLDMHQLEEVEKLVTKFHVLHQDFSAKGQAFKLTCLIELLMLLNTAFLSSKPSIKGSDLPDKIKPIFSYIEANLHKDLSLYTIGQLFYFNPSYFSRLFKKTTGVNYHEYIIFKRISKAKSLLLKGINVTETCSLCGFNDYANFLRVFRKYVGVSPGKYVTK